MGQWTQRDREVLWHPFSPLDPQGAFAPLKVDKAQGAYYHLENGKKLFDGISSWWVNLHGHGHPYLLEKLQRQFVQLDQVLFAGFTHEEAITFGERLLRYTGMDYSKVFLF